MDQRERLVDCCPIFPATQDAALDASMPQAHHLILHQGDQRRNDQDNARSGNGRKLIA